MDIIKALNRRYATKKFDAKRKLSAKQMETIKEVIRLTPTSYGIQRMQCFIITDQKTKEALFPYSHEQIQITTCSHLIVFAIPTKITKDMIDAFLTLIKKIRGSDNAALKARRERIENALKTYEKRCGITSRLREQVNIAVGNLCTSCALMKIDTCPIGGMQPEMYDKVLGLKKKGLQTVLACALGYRAKDDGYAKVKKVRIPTKDLFENL